MTAANHRQLAWQVMNAALKAVDPARAVTDYFQANPQLVAQINDSPGRVLVVGAGKAGAPMAAAVSEIFDHKIEAGRVVVKYGHSAVDSDMPDSTRVEISEAGHPVPDRAGLEAAQAIEMLGRNGLDTQQILDGAARSTVLLANATGGEFAQSADIATDVMALWNIEGENMSQAVDGITNVVNNSKFSIDDYALAQAQGGGVAAAAGVELDQFNTVIAGISPLFASGSDAGTSFKTFLQRMVPQSNKAADAMASLGISFFDANGNMKDMGEIAGMLREKLYEEFQMTVQLGGATEEMADAAEKANKKIPGLTTGIAEQEARMAILQRELGEVIEKYGEGSIQADKKRLAIQRLTNDLEEDRAELTNHQAALVAMTDATVECWGHDEYGQATPPAGTFSQVSAGEHHTCGVRTDGSVVCWGND